MNALTTEGRDEIRARFAAALTSLDSIPEDALSYKEYKNILRSIMDICPLLNNILDLQREYDGWKRRAEEAESLSHI